MGQCEGGQGECGALCGECGENAMGDRTMTGWERGDGEDSAECAQGAGKTDPNRTGSGLVETDDGEGEDGGSEAAQGRRPTVRRS